jgi:hypothetical protein
MFVWLDKPDLSIRVVFNELFSAGDISLAQITFASSILAGL